MPIPYLQRANCAAGAWFAQLSRRQLAAAAGVGILGALLTGSAALAAAPLLVFLAIQAIRAQSCERLIVGAAAATLWLDNPSEVPYMARWSSPFEIFGKYWFHSVQKTIPQLRIPLSPALLIVLYILARSITAKIQRPDRSTHFYLRSCVIAAAALAFAEVYGVSRGGDFRQSFYQLSALLMALGIGVSTSLVASPALLRGIERVLLIAAASRAVVALWVYITIFRPDGTSYLYVTTHSDSVLWVVAIALLAGRVVTTFRLESQRGRTALALLLLSAIAVNNRRLAFVELGVVLAYVCWATPPRLKALRGRVLTIAVPVLAVYVAAALASPPSRIFQPVQALVSVNDEEDSSTRSREIENYNLMVTIRQSGILGTGFGHEYTELIVGPDISKSFVQYRFLPHNSILGLWAFGGLPGFLGFWTPLIVAVAAAARLRRHVSRHLRATGVWLVGAMVAYALMAWGDIGLQSELASMLVGLSAGIATGIGRSHPARLALQASPQLSHSRVVPS